MPQIELATQAFAANAIFIPVAEHINLVYIGLSIAFACVLVYWFVYTRRH
jgi:hypothetical protein